MKWFSTLIFLFCIACFGWAERMPLSLSLSDAIETAFQKSPDLKSAEGRLKIAYGIEKEMKSQAGLQLVGHGLLMSTSESTMIPSVSGYDPMMMFTVPSGVRSGGGAVASFPLFTGGKISGLKDEATYDREAEEFRFRAAKVQLAYMTTLAYDRILVSKEAVLVAEEVVKENAEDAKRAKLLVDSGKVAAIELYRANAELSKARRKLIDSKNDLVLRRLDLLRLLGLDLDTPLILTDTLPETTKIPDKEALLRDAEENNPELLAKKKEMASALGLLQSSQGEYWPQTYFYGRADALSGSPGQFNGTSFGLIASFPIFDSGKRDGKVDQAKGKVQELRSGEEALALDIRHEVTRAWLNLESAQASLTEARDEEKSAEENLRVSRLRLESGKSIQLEWLDALSIYAKAKLEALEARFAFQAARADLDRSVGKIP